MAGNEAVDFAGAGRRSTYELIARTLGRFGYRTLARSDKGLVRRYLAKVTGRSRAQLTRLVRQYLDTGRIADRRGGPRRARSQGATPRTTSAFRHEWTSSWGRCPDRRPER